MNASVMKVVHLVHPPPTADAPPNRKPPPLQRFMKPTLKRSEPTTAGECLESHVMQIEQRVAGKAQARREARARHAAELEELNDRVNEGFEELAARRAWHREIAQDQLAQRDEKQAAALLDYKESRSAPEYWPYEAAKPGFALPEPKSYGAELKKAAAHKAAVEKLKKEQGKGAATSLRLRSEREKELRQHDTLEKMSPQEVRAALNAAAARKRAIVGAAAQKRAKERAERLAADGGNPISPRGPSGADSGTYLTGAAVLEQMGRMQLKEAQRALRLSANQLQLKEILMRQAAEKRERDLGEHSALYGGEAMEASASLAKLTAKAEAGQEEAARKAKEGARRRAELEQAIALKQIERLEMRKRAMAEQRRLAGEAAREEALVFGRDEARKREQQAEVRLALTQQEAEQRRRKKKEAEADA